jgi:hypothetical protein
MTVAVPSAVVNDAKEREGVLEQELRLPEENAKRVEVLEDKELTVEVVRADGDFRIRERYKCVFTIVPSISLKRIELADGSGRVLGDQPYVRVEEEDDLTQSFKDWLLCRRKTPVRCGPQEFTDGNSEMTLWTPLRDLTNEEVRAVQKLYLFDQV